MTEKPKRRWLQFSLRTFLLLATAAAVLLAVVYNRRATMNMRRESARHIVTHELMRLHAVANETDPTKAPFFEGLYDNMLDTMLNSAVEQDWGYRFIPAANRRYIPQTNSPANEFEREALARMRNGEEEIWQTGRDGAARYAKAIRSTQNCARCHISLQAGSSGFLGVAVIDLPPK